MVLTMSILGEFDEYFKKVKEVLINFIPYYYSVVDERTPSAIRERALVIRDKDIFFSTSDGDRVEVDANVGVVRLVERAS